MSTTLERPTERGTIAPPMPTIPDTVNEAVPQTYPTFKASPMMEAIARALGAPTPTTEADALYQARNYESYMRWTRTCDCTGSRSRMWSDPR